MASLYDTVAGAFDHVAGRTDEATAGFLDAVGQTSATTDSTRAFDHLFGSTDEWAASMGDNLALETDEWVGRTFDDTPGGGIGESARDAAGFLGGVGDFAAGSTDEWVGRNPLQSRLLVVVVVLAVLGYLFRPLLEVAAGVAGGEG